MDGKPFYQSKTVLFNVLTFVIALIALLLDQSWIQQNPQIVLYLGLAQSIVNVILRSLTRQPMRFKQ